MGAQLSQITTKPEIRPPRITIHGKGGSGKTSFGASIPDCLFLPAEEGLGKLEVAHLPKPASFVEVMNALSELHAEDHPYKALVIDTIDHIEPLVWQYVCDSKSQGNKTYENIEDFGYQKGYTYADQPWIDFFLALDLLRRKGMTIVALCHNEVKPITDPIIGPYDSVQPKLHKRANALLYEWSDIVGYLDIEKAALEKEGARNRKMDTAHMLGTRVLYLEDIGGFEAKNRYDLPARLEVPMDNPYGALRVELIKALGLDKKEAA